MIVGVLCQKFYARKNAIFCVKIHVWGYYVSNTPHYTLYLNKKSSSKEQFNTVLKYWWVVCWSTSVKDISKVSNKRHFYLW